MSQPVFHKIVPSLPVKNIQVTLDYYCNVLGFSEPWTWGNPVKDGGCTRDHLNMLFWQNEELANRCVGLGLMLYVTGIDEIYEEWMKKGIPIAAALHNYEYGIREFAIVDCNGYYLRIASEG
jgi:uncharacterized glyoxalase superfamily protein PhnB